MLPQSDGFQTECERQVMKACPAADAVGLTELMIRTTGRPEVMVGLIDGPVALDHPELAADMVRGIPDGRAAACSATKSLACVHGTFVAGVLCARRGSVAPAICPGCTLLVRPIFSEHDLSRTPGRLDDDDHQPSATAEDLAQAILDLVNAGARIMNLSAAMTASSSGAQRSLELALDYAARRGTIVVAAAGNQATIGSTAITRHPAVIPVVGCDAQGLPMRLSNLGRSIGLRGLRAPGDSITSLGAQGPALTLSGTSAAAPFVTGTLALVWSEFPSAPASAIKLAVRGRSRPSRRTVVPPLLDAWGAYQAMTASSGRQAS